MSPLASSAAVPAENLSAVGAIQIGVSNPSPGGGASIAHTLAVVNVAKLVIFAAPQGAGQTNGPWLVAAAAVDTSGNPIPGLPVTFDAKAGTFGTNQGVTDSLGTFSTGYLPPSLSTSSQTDILTATTGSQTAVAVVSLPLRQTRLQPRPNCTEHYASPLPDQMLPQTARLSTHPLPLLA